MKSKFVWVFILIILSMPTANYKSSDFLCLSFAILLGFLHFFALQAVPGLHYDEAWAMNYAYRIAYEPGFWPMTAMSPYTAPWAHYWAALWMKLFSPSLLVFRGSQVCLALAGLFFVGITLRRQNKQAAFYFPLIVALIPSLLLNHRFAIELNGFHVLAFGVMVWGICTRKIVLVALAFLLGCTSHILFFAWGLGLTAALALEGKVLLRREKWVGALCFMLLSGFFFHVFRSVPEKGKALALFVATLGLALFWCVGATEKKFWQKIPIWLVALLSAVFFVNALFFLEGSWTLATQTGLKLWQTPQVLGLFLFLCCALFLLKKAAVPVFWRNWFLAALIALGVMMLKPAPRYFETALLCLAVFLSMGLVNILPRARLAILAILVLHAGIIYLSYFTVSPREEKLQLFLWKDSSRDFQSKQKLVAFLGGSACRISDIKFVDSRVYEALLALSRADWPVRDGSCPWKNIYQRTDHPGFEVADFVLEN